MSRLVGSGMKCSVTTFLFPSTPTRYAMSVLEDENQKRQETTSPIRGKKEKLKEIKKMKSPTAVTAHQLQTIGIAI